jgi:prevent-host-death family protein
MMAMSDSELPSTSLYGMHEAKTNLSQLIQKAQAGEPVIITNNGKPVARIVPFEEKPKGSRLGFLKGVKFDAELFDSMDAEIADLFEGKS